MGKRLTASEETALLQATVREAHEATQALRVAIKDAKELGLMLVSEFERIHATEIKQLSNFFTKESNRVSADLNTRIEQARKMITDQIMAGKAVFDADRREVVISFGPYAFDSAVPPPYPNEQTWKESQ